MLKVALLAISVSFAMCAWASDTDYVRHWTGQGWKDRKTGEISLDAQRDWYDISQGSRLIRADWFNALTLPDTSVRFANRENIEALGFPYMKQDSDLPIGFVIDHDEKDSIEYVGLNCAACHTTRLVVNETTEVLVHGGQSMSNFRAFIEQLVSSVEDVNSSKKKRRTFYNKIRKRSNGQSFEEFEKELKNWLKARKSVDRLLDGLPKEQNWGHGRADAVRYIQAAGRKAVQKKEPVEVTVGDAPVDYPHTWNANQLGRLQHNGLVENSVSIKIFGTDAKIGAFARNWIEALGVFAQIDVNKKGRVSTSIKGGNLLRIEKQLATLQSPNWDDAFSEIAKEDPRFKRDLEKAKVGAKVYAKSCAHCHGVVTKDASGKEDLSEDYVFLKNADQSPRYCVDDPGKTIKGPFVCIQPVVDLTLINLESLEGKTMPQHLIGTDPTMACNAALHQISTGKLNGRLRLDTPKKSAFTKFGPRDYTTNVIKGLMFRDLYNHRKELAKVQLESELEGLFQSWVGDFQSSIPQYKSVNSVLAEFAKTLKTQPNEYYDRLFSCAVRATEAHKYDPKKFPLPAYKARPLNGVWATPPYLHNGSVKSISELLKPQAERAPAFFVGNGNYDPINIGIDHQRSGSSVFQVYHDDGSRVIGNWNGGHEYGVNLTTKEKESLIEYLKSL